MKIPFASILCAQRRITIQFDANCENIAPHGLSGTTADWRLCNKIHFTHWHFFGTFHLLREIQPFNCIAVDEISL